MKNLDRSICSTCRFIADCVLTTDKSNISSCSDYVHNLEIDNEPLPMVNFKYATGGYEIRQEAVV
jgi:hypothetical protein